MNYVRTEPVAPSPDTVIWRYMDDWKFEDLLKPYSEHAQWQPPKPGTRTVHFNDPGQLWFAFPGSFGDNKEGTFPEPNEDPETYCDRMAERMGLSKDEADNRKKRFLAADTKPLRDGIFFMAQLCGVSCWQAREHESRSMWDDFVAEKNGVVIRSICKQVEHALTYAHNSPAKKAAPSVCSVGYVDHAAYFLPSDGFPGLLSIVQESYSHENEVRFVAKSAALAAIPTQIKTPLPLDPANWTASETAWATKREKYIAEITDQARSAYSRLRTSREEGFRLPIALDGLMSEVVLKPGCTEDYESLIRDQLGRAGCEATPIRKSSFT